MSADTANKRHAPIDAFLPDRAKRFRSENEHDQAVNDHHGSTSTRTPTSPRAHARFREQQDDLRSKSVRSSMGNPAERVSRDDVDNGRRASLDSYRPGPSSDYAIPSADQYRPRYSELDGRGRDHGRDRERGLDGSRTQRLSPTANGRTSAINGGSSPNQPKQSEPEAHPSVNVQPTSKPSSTRPPVSSTLTTPNISKPNEMQPPPPPPPPPPPKEALQADGAMDIDGSPSADRQAEIFLSSLTALMSASYEHTRASERLDSMKHISTSRAKFFDDASTRAHENQLLKQESLVQKANDTVVGHTKPLLDLMKGAFAAASQPQADLVTKREVQDLKDELARVMEREKEQSRRIDHLTARTVELEDSMKNVSNDLTGYSDRFLRLEAEDGSMRKRIKDYASNEGNIMADAKRLSVRLTTTEKNMNTIQDISKELITKVEQNARDFKQEMSKVPSLLEGVKKEINQSINETHDSLSKNITSANAANKALSTAVKIEHAALENKMSKTLETHKTSIDVVQSNYNELNTVVQGLQKRSYVDSPSSATTQNTTNNNNIFAKSLVDVNEKVNSLMDDVDTLQKLLEQGCQVGDKWYPSVLERQDVLQERLDKSEITLSSFSGLLEQVEALGERINGLSKDSNPPLTEHMNVKFDDLRKWVNDGLKAVTMSSALQRKTDFAALEEKVEDLFNEVKGATTESSSVRPSLAEQHKPLLRMYERLRILEHDKEQRHKERVWVLENRHDPASLHNRLKEVESTSTIHVDAVAALKKNIQCAQHGIAKLREDAHKAPAPQAVTAVSDQAMATLKDQVTILQTELHKLQDQRPVQRLHNLENLSKVQRHAIADLEYRFGILNTGQLAKQILDQLNPRVLAEREPMIRMILDTHAAQKDEIERLKKGIENLDVRLLEMKGTQDRSTNQRGAHETEANVDMDAVLEVIGQQLGPMKTQIDQLYEKVVKPIEQRLQTQMDVNIKELNDQISTFTEGALQTRITEEIQKLDNKVLQPRQKVLGDHIDSSIDGFDKTINALRTQMKAADCVEKVKRLEDWMQDCEDGLGSLKTTVKTCVQGGETLDKQMQDQVREVAQLRSKFDECVVQVDTVRRQLDDRAEMVVDLEQTVNQRAEQVDRLENRTQHCEQDIAKWQTKHGDTDHRLSRLQQHVNEARINSIKSLSSRARSLSQNGTSTTNGADPVLAPITNGASIVPSKRAKASTPTSSQSSLCARVETMSPPTKERQGRSKSEVANSPSGRAKKKNGGAGSANVD